MRKLTLLLAVIAVVAAVFAVQALAGTTSVTWKLGASKTVKIKKGGTVKWVWGDGLSHNVQGKGFSSKFLMGKGKTYSHRFNSKGTFKIVCKVHPGGMTTTVKVG